MKLTEEEKQIIIDKRIKEEGSKPKKTGILKHDLYISTDMSFEDYPMNETLTYDQLLEYVEKFKESFVKHPKGMEFECYIENGIESWSDVEDGYIECQDAQWAKENLEKIKKYK